MEFNESVVYHDSLDGLVDAAIHANSPSEQALVEHAADKLEHAVEGSTADRGASAKADPGSASDDDNESDINVSDTLLSVLAKNLAGTWFNSQRARHKVWAFFCPTDSTLSWEERGRAKDVDCLICYAER